MRQFTTPSAAAAAYTRWLERTRYADRTKEQYARRVAHFTTWLEDHGPEYADALIDEDVRDYAARDFRRELLTVRKHSPASVGLYMSVLGSFFEWVGLGRPRGVHVDVPPSTSVGITDEATLRAVFRAAHRRGPRDYAMVTLMALAGLRVGELAALDVDDVLVHGRQGYVQVRYGKGGKPREVPLGSQARDAVAGWMRERGDAPGPLFTAAGGRRLSVRSVQYAVNQVGKSVGVALRPHLLRHTYGRRFVESGGDLVALQHTMGHSAVSTTARYARPSREFLAAHVDRLGVDL